MTVPLGCSVPMTPGKPVGVRTAPAAPSGDAVDGDPPGMYPSPTRPGSLELWTGVTWLRHLADDPPRPVR